MTRTTASPIAISIRPAFVGAGCEDDGGDEGEEAAIITGANIGMSAPISGRSTCGSFLREGCRTGAVDADRGRTIRQPIKAAAIELIGKEANRWEEQYFLGQDEDAEITYGLMASSDHFHDRLAEFVKRFGLTRVAEIAGSSRPAVTKLVKTKATPTNPMREKLEEAFAILVGVKENDDTGRERLRKRAAAEGLNQTALVLGIDRGNLSAMLAGRRPLNRTVAEWLVS